MPMVIFERRLVILVANNAKKISDPILRDYFLNITKSKDARIIQHHVICDWWDLPLNIKWENEEMISIALDKSNDELSSLKIDRDRLIKSKDEIIEKLKKHMKKLENCNKRIKMISAKIEQLKQANEKPNSEMIITTSKSM